MDGACGDGISGIFCIVFAERVQYGYTVAAVQELDISIKWHRSAATHCEAGVGR